ncbi:pentapeptide repeat-containing protein [Burkholderia cepacia]|uniref:anti-phage Hailong system effector protein HalA n=1 Tax=Burkholderia cepacia TaxID=292 RepID=UPI002FE178B0
MKNFKFSNCDFQGNFTTMDLSFTGCEFINTDLGYSNWKNIKFSRCKFIRTSFTLATFEQCQFIDCSWEEIGISGTETKLFDTTISNPWDFVLSAYTNTDKDVLKQHGNTNPAHQTMRLEETKVKLSRAILSSSERNSDDLVYYEAVKTYLTQSLHSRRVRAAYDRDTTKSTATKLKSIWVIALLDTESTILKLSGSINAWGYSLARPALVGFALICIFALIYFLTGISSTAKLAAMTSFDVTLLVGYTKHASEQSTWPAQIVYGVNALLGLWWYAIFVPTVINRISRVR